MFKKVICDYPSACDICKREVKEKYNRDLGTGGVLSLCKSCYSLMNVCLKSFLEG